MAAALQGVAFTDAAIARVYVLAGDAGVILRSRVTGTEFTYKVTKAARGGHYVVLETNIVKLTVGEDSHFGRTVTPYLGRIDGGRFSMTRNSELPADDTAVKAFMFFWRHLSDGCIPDGLEVLHTGRCGACSRKLKTQESILNGIGPECARKRELRCA